MYGWSDPARRRSGSNVGGNIARTLCSEAAAGKPRRLQSFQGCASSQHSHRNEQKSTHIKAQTRRWLESAGEYCSQATSTHESTPHNISSARSAHRASGRSALGQPSGLYQSQPAAGLQARAIHREHRLFRRRFCVGGFFVQHSLLRNAVFGKPRRLFCSCVLPTRSAERTGEVYPRWRRFADSGDQRRNNMKHLNHKLCLNQLAVK